ncbi:unnamed protein product, partial [Brenthis ino]
MEINNDLLNKLKTYGVGRRKLDDDLFKQNIPPRLGIYDVDEEQFCHAVIQTACTVPGCNFTADSLLDFENHYNASHRFACSQCKKCLPSPHLLDLHLQEQHDSFFSVLAAKRPSYSCYIEECKEKFMTAEERLDHCVKIHKLPKDFRFDTKPKHKNKKKKPQSMEVDGGNGKTERMFAFNNNKQKGFKRFTNDQQRSTASVDVDEIMSDIRESLP